MNIYQKKTKKKTKSELEKTNVTIRRSRKPKKNHLNLVFKFDKFFRVSGKICKLILLMIVVLPMRVI